MRLSEKMAGQRDNWNILQWYMAFPQRDMLDEWIPEVAKLEAENEALRKYVNHDWLLCDHEAFLASFLVGHSGQEQFVCKCGLDALLTKDE